MRKKLILSIVVISFVALGFSMQDANYKLMLLNIEAATETALFLQEEDGIVDFHSITDLHFQSQKAVYKTEGKIANNYITDYHLTFDYNGAETSIDCTIKENTLHYSFADRQGEISIEKPLLIIENNVGWMWQLVYNLYQINGFEEINVFVPQLLIKDFSEILPLEIQKETKLDGYQNVFFDYNGQSGLLKVNTEGHVEKMLMGGAILERTK